MNPYAIGLGLVVAVLLMVMQIAGKATRDTLFLSEYDVWHLPKAMIFAAILSVAAVLGVSRATARVGPARVLRMVLALSTGLFLTEWALAATHPKVVAVLVYLHVSVIGAIVISTGWSVLNERFNPYAARNTFGTFAAAMTFGGVLGGLLAQRVGTALSVTAMLPALALVGAVTLAVLTVIDSRVPPVTVPAPAASRLGLRELLFDVPFFRLMVLLVGMTAAAETLLDYALKAEAAARLAGEQQLIGFFSVFYAAVSLATFLVQTTLGRRALRRFGLGVSLAIQPLAVVVFGVTAMAMTRLWSIVLVRGSQAVLANSLFRAGFEQLYTPIPPQQKRPSKIIIDVGAQRLGDLAGSGLVMVVLLLAPVLATQTVLALAVAASGVSLYLMRLLHRGYVAQLARNLRAGVVTLDDDRLIDATTRRTYLRAAGPGTLPYRRQRPGSVVRATDGARHLVDSVQAILTGEPDRIVPVLQRRPFDARLAAQVVPFLAESALADAAERALHSVAPKVAGQLADAFLAPATPLEARLRIPWLLVESGSALVPQVLMQGLKDDDFAIRYRSGQMLAYLRSLDPELVFDRDVVHRLAQRELKASSHDRAARDATVRRLNDPGHAAPAGPDEGAIGGLGHVFNLLGLVNDTKVIKLAVLALRGEDEALRGTALEYLANVLPERLFNRLAAHWRH